MDSGRTPPPGTPGSTASVRTSANPADSGRVATYRSATMLQRIGGLLVDTLLFIVAVPVVAVLVQWIWGPGGLAGCEGAILDDSCVPSAEALFFSRVAFWSLAAVWLVSYAWTVERGSSIGHRSTESMVVDARTGDTIGDGRALLRTVVGIVGLVPLGAGLLVALTNRDRRALHDLAAGTRVIAD